MRKVFHVSQPKPGSHPGLPARERRSSSPEIAMSSWYRVEMKMRIATGCNEGKQKARRGPSLTLDLSC